MATTLPRGTPAATRRCSAASLPAARCSAVIAPVAPAPRRATANDPPAFDWARAALRSVGTSASARRPWRLAAALWPAFRAALSRPTVVARVEATSATRWTAAT